MTTLPDATAAATSGVFDTTPAAGNKIIHLVRHAQGFHNLSWENHTIPDPLLTPYGKTQCAEVASTFPAAQVASIQLLAASPLRRTLYTAALSFPSLLGQGHKIIAIPQAQENSDEPADTGSAPEDLAKEFPADQVDLALVHEGWNSKTGVYAPDPKALEARARFVRGWLREREERVVVLVTHGAFLHYLTQDWSGFRPELGTAWHNCEWRTYEFKMPVGEGESESESEDGDASLVETKASRERRLGMGAGEKL